MPVRAFITGVAGTAISPDERAFLREAQPWGLILFKRNVENQDQVSALVGDFRNIMGSEQAPVLIDQEGGRVQRMGPPNWPAYPPGIAYGHLYDRDPAKGLAAARLGARLIADDLARVGINVDCLPLADVPIPGADLVIGDRAYGETAGKVSAIAAAVTEGLADGGILPVLKHIPGHGRGPLDSHQALPVVNADRATLEATDFAAFLPLIGLPMAMTAHVVFTAIDPVSPATTSAKIVRDVIRGWMGFKGLLMSDDISMGALSGSLRERSRASLAAGCDVILYCKGRLQEMQDVAAECPMLAGVAERRAKEALAARRPAKEFDVAAGRAAFASLMAGIHPVGSRMAAS